MTAYPTQTTFKTLLLRDCDYFNRFFLSIIIIDFQLIMIQNYTERVLFPMIKLTLVGHVSHRCTNTILAAGYAMTGLLRRCGG